MITKTTRNVAVGSPVNAGTSITRSVKNRAARTNVNANFNNLTPAQRAFARQLQVNGRKAAPVMAATNTANIMARPDFMELLPMFVQKLIITDVFGSVAMKSRQQLIPYFKFVAEGTKGVTKDGDVLSSPFMNRQGKDPHFTGRVVKDEAHEDAANMFLAFTPVLPGSVTIKLTDDQGAVTPVYDDGAGTIGTGTINYSTGEVTGLEGTAAVTYQYDNETVGPDSAGNYGARMAKGRLVMDEINLVAEAHELACYWSVFSAFAAQQEYGSNIGDIAKEAAISEITAEINANGFNMLAEAAKYKPQFDWDASPVHAGSVVPSDYLNMFKLKLGQAAASIYQQTNLARPNRLVVGTNTAEYISMINGFKADNIEDSVGPYKLGTLDAFEVYVAPDYDPDTWVMACKSNDLRRNSALFGEYMPISEAGPITLPDMQSGSGIATMYGMKIVNPATVVSGRIIGSF